MVLAPSVAGLFKWRQFEPEVILLAVGGYLRFSLSYRDVEELLAERGLHADPGTGWRWVQRYARDMERRLRARLNPTTDSWRMDSDSHPGERQVALPLPGGGFFRRHPRLPPLGPGRTQPRPSAFRAKALTRANHPMPRGINTDGHSAYPP